MDIQNIIQMAGGQTALAKAIGLKQGHVSYWVKAGKIPTDHIIAVSGAVNWRITPHQLNPLAYPNPNDGLPPEVQGQAA